MTARNPLHVIKDVAVGALSAAAGAAGSAVGAAQGAVDAVRRAPADEGAQPEPVPDAQPGPAEPQPAAEPEPAPDPGQDAEPGAVPEAVTDAISRGEPVNVTEQLGFDPSPVDRRAPRAATSIDAAADPDEVDATPADLAGRNRQRDA